MRTEKGFLIFGLLVILALDSVGQNSNQLSVTIYTPQNNPITGTLNVFKWGEEDFSASEIATYNSYYAQNYPYATRVADPTRTYNCHAFAWWVNHGGEKVWLNNPTPFMTDGSFESCASYSATHVYYPTGGHSAVMTTAPYYVKSKWGPYGLYYHRINQCPYDSSDLEYYRIATKISGPSSLSPSSSGYYPTGTYTITNLPTGGSVSWTVTSGASIQSGANSSTMTARFYSAATVSATLTTAAGLQYPLASVSVDVNCIPTITDITNVGMGMDNLSSHFRVVTDMPNATYTWSVDGGAYITSLPYPDDASFVAEPNVWTYIVFPSTGTYTVSVYGTNGTYVSNVFSKSFTIN